LAFIPIEPAFMLAVTNDGSLFQEAWERNVLLVSPSTLLFVVRTATHLWRQEAQTRNTQEIARRGAELYDKFAGFVGDLQNVGTRLKQAREAYDLAESKPATGRGNVIRQAEMLRSLGVKPAKTLPALMVESAFCDEEETDRGGCLGGFRLTEQFTCPTSELTSAPAESNSVQRRRGHRRRDDRSAH